MVYKELEDAKEVFHTKCRHCYTCIKACQVEDPKPVEAALNIIFDKPANVDSLWRCVNCHTCSYACPENLDPRSLVYLARRRFPPPPKLQVFINNILSVGAVMELNPEIEEIREACGAIKLKPAKDVVEALR